MHAVKSWRCNWFFFAGGDFPMASWWKEWNLYIRENAWFNGWIIFERINFGLCGMWNLWTKEQYKGFFKQYQVRPLQLTALQPVRFFNLESNLHIRRKMSANIESIGFGRQFFEVRGRKSVDMTKQHFNHFKICWRNVSDFDIDGRTQAYR